MITSFVLVVDRAQMIAPDRIQIMEIDLNAVRVSGSETVLYNTDAPKAPASTPAEPETEPEPVPETKPDADIAPTEIEQPTFVEEEKQPEPEKKPDPVVPEPVPESPTPAPKKKTVVRVNRDVVSLDRTLTVSVVDALRVAMTRCWNIDTGRPDLSDIRAVAHLTMRQNGTVSDVWFESASRADDDPAFAYVLDTIRAAISACQPFKMLPPGEYNAWKKIQLTFYPTQGKVM